MNKDQIKGSVKQAEGKAKQVTGKIIGNKALEVKGIIENTAGKVQKARGDQVEQFKKGNAH